MCILLHAPAPCTSIQRGAYDSSNSLELLRDPDAPLFYTVEIKNYHDIGAEDNEEIGSHDVADAGMRINLEQMMRDNSVYMIVHTAKKQSRMKYKL
jgi:hypothetical protein